VNIGVRKAKNQFHQNLLQKPSNDPSRFLESNKKHFPDKRENNRYKNVSD